ncbi:DUF6678 family protein [Hymenobacter bucti]|uniref:DUF6678 family protein n=1 Tax=Hymenobacter bucti TaxID=1844114 RepID=A0ABW4QQU5_9BACT
MNKLEALADFLRQLHCQVRLKHEAYEAPEGWAGGIGLPVRGYIELNGPWPFRQIEWLEINPAVTEHIGRLVKPKQHNYSEEISAFLHSKSIAYSIKEGTIRIPFSEFTG